MNEEQHQLNNRERTLRSLLSYPEARSAGLTKEKLDAIDQELKTL